MSKSKIINQIKKTFRPSNLHKRFLHFALKGKNVQCPCCGSMYITFLPAGLKKRANAKCIKCNSLERHRTLWLFLKEKNDIFTNQIKLLHAAPEKFFYQKFSSLKNMDYHPIDLNPDKYNYGFKTIKMDVTDLNYTDKTFDAVICNHVLEHVSEDKKAIQEFFRVLKPNGWAILNVPVQMNREKTFEEPYINDAKKQEELFGQHDHVRIYGNDYITRLTDAGFKVEVIDYSSKFDHNQQFKYGLKPNELIFYCTK